MKYDHRDLSIALSEGPTSPADYTTMRDHLERLARAMAMETFGDNVDRIVHVGEPLVWRAPSYGKVFSPGSIGVPAWSLYMGLALLAYNEVTRMAQEAEEAKAATGLAFVGSMGADNGRNS